MTEHELEQLGCKRINWNGGAFWEYYLPITGDGRGVRDSRLSVRFNERCDHTRRAYLIVPNTMVYLEHVNTIEKFKTMYGLITGKVLP